MVEQIHAVHIQLNSYYWKIPKCDFCFMRCLHNSYEITWMQRSRKYCHTITRVNLTCAFKLIEVESVPKWEEKIWTNDTHTHTHIVNITDKQCNVTRSIGELGVLFLLITNINTYFKKTFFSCLIFHNCWIGHAQYNELIKHFEMHALIIHTHAILASFYYSNPQLWLYCF